MIAIVDYGVGNLRSLQHACESVGLDVRVTSDTAALESAAKLILPGVGAFRDASATLRQSGLDRILRAHAAAEKPLLGICLGHQLLFEESDEDGVSKGLGLIPGRVERIDPVGHKVPHMGWNDLKIKRHSDLTAHLVNGDHMYFVHSYSAVCADECVIATVGYGAELIAAVKRGNVYGVQFHPEKSGEAGLQILKNFGEL